MILRELIPGPNEPKELHTFLRPLVDDFKISINGIVEVFDGDSRENFLMHANITILSVYMPALTTLTSTQRSNSYTYYRFCNRNELSCRIRPYVYCPLVSPVDRVYTGAKKQ
jgi:hypothetical protein